MCSVYACIIHIHMYTHTQKCMHFMVLYPCCCLACTAPTSDATVSGRRESGGSVRGGKAGMAEIGRAEVTLAFDVGAAGVKKVRIPLMRRNALVSFV